MYGFKEFPSKTISINSNARKKPRNTVLRDGHNEGFYAQGEQLQQPPQISMEIDQRQQTK